MGNLVKFCIDCNKKKEKEIDEPLKTLSRTMEIKDKFCKGTITIEENIPEELPFKRKKSAKSSKSNICLYTNQFRSNPFNIYKIVEEYHPDRKLVSLLSNSKIFRYMTIIEGGNNINDKVKEKQFLDTIKELQLLDHPNINKIYEVYISDNKYYIISNYNGNYSVLEKMKNYGNAEEPTVKILMNQILNLIIYIHENLIYNIGLELKNLFLFEMTIKSDKLKLLKKEKKTKKEKKIKSIVKR